jgi:hypothetical protein
VSLDACSIVKKMDILNLRAAAYNESVIDHFICAQNFQIHHSDAIILFGSVAPNLKVLVAFWSGHVCRSYT